MKKNYYYLAAIALVATLLSSCTSAYISNVPSAQVRDVHFFEPVSSITLVEGLNTTSINDSVNLISNHILNDILRETNRRYPITQAILLNNEEEYQRYKREMLNLAMAVEQDRGINDHFIPQIIKNMLESRGSRFGLVVVHTGFTRTFGSYLANEALEYAKSIILNLPPSSVENDNSEMYIMIFDALNNNIALWNKVSYGSDPLDRSVIRSQYKEILDDYFK